MSVANVIPYLNFKLVADRRSECYFSLRFLCTDN